MPDGRVLIGMASGPLTASPTWTRIDNTNGLVSAIEITSGKQTEFDKTEAGRYTVYLNDKTGLFDPANSSSPYFGTLDGKQILLQLYNPVDSTWYSRARGIIDEFGFDLNPATRSGVSILSNVQIKCVGIFDYLAGAELLPGVHGDVPPAGAESTIFYEDGEVDDRIVQILADVGVPSARYVVFSGNVMVQETKYDPGDSALVALRDAADAETPYALANIYEDRAGKFVFHGRQARIDPVTVAAGAGGAWTFGQWKIGDGAAITGDSAFAQIRPPYQYSQARNKIVNAALIYQRGVDRATIPSLVVSDATSITAYGVHSQSYQDSINDGHKTNGDSASEDCVRSANFLVTNFKDPRIRIEALTVMSVSAGDARATPTWNVLCKSDISDLVRVKTGYPGGTGIDEDFFIEGFTQTIVPLNTTHDMVTLSLNVSPSTNGDTSYDD